MHVSNKFTDIFSYVYIELYSGWPRILVVSHDASLQYASKLPSVGKQVCISESPSHSFGRIDTKSDFIQISSLI